MFVPTISFNLSFWEAALKGPLTNASTLMGDFLLLILFLLLIIFLLLHPPQALIPVSRLQTQPQGLNPSLMAKIPASKAEF